MMVSTPWKIDGCAGVVINTTAPKKKQHQEDYPPSEQLALGLCQVECATATKYYRLHDQLTRLIIHLSPVVELIV